MLCAVAGCHAARKFGTSEQLLWIRDGIEHAKEKWYFHICITESLATAL